MPPYPAYARFRWAIGPRTVICAECDTTWSSIAGLKCWLCGERGRVAGEPKKEPAA